MNPAVKTAKVPVPPDEIKRRVAEHRRMSYERRAPAVMIYPPPQQLCPWPGCSLHINAVDFRLDVMADPSLLEKWMASWWLGSGLVGQCPSCGKYVLFGYEEKRAVSDPSSFETAMLPHDWAQHARLAPPAAS